MNTVVIVGDTWHRYTGKQRAQSVSVDFPEGVRLQDVLELLEDFRKGNVDGNSQEPTDQVE